MGKETTRLGHSRGHGHAVDAVLRFLYTAVRIGESTARNGTFDYAWIEIEQNGL